MIARQSPVVMLTAVGAALVCAMMPSKATQSGSLPKIEGSLTPTTQRLSCETVPRVSVSLDVGVDAAAKAQLKDITEAKVRFVSVERSSFTITVREHIVDLERREQTASAHPKKVVRKPKIEEKPAPPQPVVAAVTVLAPPAPPVPTLPTTFTEIDDALQASPATKTINVRIKKSGVTFRLTHVGRVAEQYVLRFAIANEESTDFFLSILNVTAAGKPIHSETAGPYVCGSGKEVYGIVHFNPAAAAGKTVAVELIQSGGDRRHFPLEVSFAF